MNLDGILGFLKNRATMSAQSGPGQQLSGLWQGLFGSGVSNTPSNSTISPLQDTPQPTPTIDTRTRNITVGPLIRTTPTPSPTPIPGQVTSVQPYPTGPQTPQRTWYTQQDQRPIQASVFDSIMNYNAPEELKRLALALSSQESSGGKVLSGDNGNAVGPYHIWPSIHPISTQAAMDPTASTNYLMQGLKKRQAEGIPFADLLSYWNSRSGYVNNGPKYNVDLPQIATMSTFLRH